MEIRTAVPSDVEDLLALFAKAQQFMVDHGNPSQWPVGFPGHMQVEEDIRTGIGHVVTEGRQIVGTFCFSPGPDPLFECLQEGCWLDQDPYWVLSRVASSGEIHGVTAALFDWCSFGPVGQKNLRISTGVENLPMQGALVKHGFIRCGSLYRPNGEVRLGYQRHLP